MPKLGFKGRSKEDLEQQKKEFYWLLHNMENAPDKETEDKWRKKMENWLDAHPYTKERFNILAEKFATEHPEEIIEEAKRRGMI